MTGHVRGTGFLSECFRDIHHVGGYADPGKLQGIMPDIFLSEGVADFACGRDVALAPALLGDPKESLMDFCGRI